MDATCELAVCAGQFVAHGEHGPPSRQSAEIPIKNTGGGHGGKAPHAAMRAHLLDQVLPDDERHGNARAQTLPDNELADRVRSAQQESVPSVRLPLDRRSDLDVDARVRSPQLVEVRNSA